MGNRLLRKKLGLALKKAGLETRVYKGKGNKHRLKAAHLRFMTFYADLRRGDIVHDCDGGNHIVDYNRPDSDPNSEAVVIFGQGTSGKRLKSSAFRNGRDEAFGRGRAGYVLWIDEQLQFQDGRLSCGCPSGVMEPQSREYIEAFFVAYFEEYKNSWANESWRADAAKVLRSGGHIFDERGIMLEEWRKRSRGEQ